MKLDKRKKLELLREKSRRDNYGVSKKTLNYSLRMKSKLLRRTHLRVLYLLNLITLRKLLIAHWKSKRRRREKSGQLSSKPVNKEYLLTVPPGFFGKLTLFPIPGRLLWHMTVLPLMPSSICLKTL